MFDKVFWDAILSALALKSYFLEFHSGFCSDSRTTTFIPMRARAQDAVAPASPDPTIKTSAFSDTLVMMHLDLMLVICPELNDFLHPKVQ